MIYYDVYNNYFVDEFGEIIYDVFSYITPNELYLFRQEREDLFIIRPNGKYVEVVIPEGLPF